MVTRYSETARVTMSQKRLNSLEKEVSQVHNETQQLHSEIIPPKNKPRVQSIQAPTNMRLFAIC